MKREDLEKLGFNSDVSDVIEYEFERGDIWLHSYLDDDFITLGLYDNGDIVYIELESFNTIEKVEELISTLNIYFGNQGTK